MTDRAFIGTQIPYLIAKGLTKDASANTHFEPRGFTLPGHIEATLRMAKFLLDDTDFGRKLYSVMALKDHPYGDFRKWVLLAVLCHDLGKCGSEFQGMLWPQIHADKNGQIRPQRQQQAFRHEILSAYLLGQEPLLSWLVAQAGSIEAAWLIIAAVYGHHIKTDSPRQVCDPDDEMDRPVYLAEISSDLSKIASQYGFDPFPICPDTTVTQQGLDQWRLNVQSDSELLDKSETSFTAAIKWGVILSDSLGSMTPLWQDKVASYEGNLIDCLKGILQDDGPYPHDRTALPNGTPYLFQVDTQQRSGKDTMLVIGCGGGKTAAAYMWADKSHKLIFTNTTTGTATNIYRHYGDGHSANRSSRSETDRVMLAELCANSTIPAGDDASQEEIREDQEGLARLFNEFADFGAYETNTTIDQLLGLVAFNRHSIMWLLYIINAHIILDEFHEYDSTMLGNLRRFLEWFPGIRVLAMSATVSDALEKTVCGIRPETVIVRDRAVDNPAEWPRYCFHVVDSQDADSYFDPGTLWIVNQVKVAQDWAEAYPDALLYHSRFRYIDRKVVHQRFVDGFDKKNRSNLPRGIATQVAQSSLDISGKVLISEFAPIADLIQRLGRVGRYMTSKDEPPVHVYFYLPESVLPYHPDASMKPEICFRGSLDWAKALEAESQKRPLSQNDLDAAFRKASTKVNVDLISTKLHQTYRGAVRKSQMSACSFLPHDVKVHDLETTKRHDLIQKYEIPLYLTKEEMMLFRAEGRWVRYHYVVPPSYEYDTKHIRIGLRKPSFF